MEKYFTIDQPHKGIYKQKGSKFITLAFPVFSEKEVTSILNRTKEEYSDARHHCYAYIIGFDNVFWKVHDDGEPNNSAGNPILRQIKSFGLTNTLVIVVRYFGGTKLGISGLINAYKLATSDTLSKAKKVDTFEKKEIQFKFPYHITSEVERIIHAHQIEIIEKHFQMDCIFRGQIKNIFLREVYEKAQRIHLLEIIIS